MNKKYLKNITDPKLLNGSVHIPHNEYQEYHSNNPKYEKLCQENRNNKQLFTVIC